ncbi:MAG: LysR family transcriptional regulator [Neisseriaceae bacterium]|nr:LysR family transcriptional regulator [Neisseriaceae bacterium]
MKEMLNDMALFVATVRANGFGRAAERLNIAKSTLSTRITALENDLGVRLLNRTTRKIELTEAGQIYFDKACAILDEAVALKERLHNFSTQPTGTLTITMTDDFGKMFLAPLLGEFCERYPAIRLNLHLSQNIDDLIGERFDLAIRMGQMTDSNLIAQTLSYQRLRLYAHPDYIEKIGNPKTLKSMPQTGYLLFKSDFDSEWILKNKDKTIAIPVSSNIKSNSPGMNAYMAAQGLGIALLPKIVATPFVEQGCLKTILPDFSTAEIPIYAVTTSRLIPEKTRLLIAFLKEKLNAMSSEYSQ